MIIKKLTIGWKKLRDTVNALIDTFQEQKLIQGDGISLKRTPHGVIISVVRDDEITTPTK